MSCPICHTSKTIEYDPISAVEACTVCGTVLPSSASAGLEVLGRVLDNEAEFGRSFYKDGGVDYLDAGGKPMNRQGRAVHGIRMNEVYHRTKRAESERFMRSVLVHFGLSSLFSRTKAIFADAKKVMNFCWGDKAKLIAVASIYVATRERDKPLRMCDLADITEVDLHVVTRAINFLRTSLCIQMKDLDPSIFLERHIVHLSTLLSSSSNPPLSGSTKSHWTPSNLTYLRALSFPRVRTLAAHVLAFSSDINLSNGRAPEQVSCAAIIVAMEAVARKPVPVETEVMEELASTLGVKHFTVAERYREFSKALADWAPKLPWLDLDLDGSASGGKKGKAMSEKMRKKELVAHTEDIVLFRKGLEKKDTQKAVVGAGDLRMLSDDELERIAQETKDDEEYEEVEEDFYDDQQGEQDVPGGVNAQFQDPLVDKTAAAELLLSFSLSGPPPDVAPPPRRRARRRTGSTSTPSKIDEHGNLTATEALAQRFQASRVFAHNKRPVEYMRQRPGFVKRVRTIETALHSLQATTSSDAAGSSSAIRPSDTDRLRHVERAASSSLHDEETIHFRRLLLAGHAPVSIYTGDAQYSTDASRLEQLLWTKKAEDVLDDELFDEGELEGFVRTEEEVATLEQTPKFVEMGEPAPFDPVKEERRVRKYERDKLARKRKAKSLLVQRKTRDQTWVPELDIDSDDGAPLESISTSGNGGRRRRGPGRKGKMKGDDDDDEEDDPFAPEVKRSKIDQATKERLARLFAEDGEIEDEDGWNEQLGVEAADDVDGGSEFV